MLARCLATIVPDMTLAEAIETTRIHSVAGLTSRHIAVVTTRPFRAPHHTISDVGWIGGGHIPMPGEVSLAHHGLLCLDERPECTRHGLEDLRQPLEESVVTIARASISVTLRIPYVKARAFHNVLADFIRPANAASWAKSTMSAAYSVSETISTGQPYEVFQGLSSCIDQELITLQEVIDMDVAAFSELIRTSDIPAMMA
jgi:magnesium chelatase family protein